MAGERVSNLKILKGYLYADVRLGHSLSGAEVTVNVRLSTTRAETQEALGPLYDLIRETGRTLAGQGLVAGSVEAAEAEARTAVLAQVPKRVEQQVNARTAEVKAALRVVAAVGPPQETEPYDNRRERTSALRRLRDALNRANI